MAVRAMAIKVVAEAKEAMVEAVVVAAAAAEPSLCVR